MRLPASPARRLAIRTRLALWYGLFSALIIAGLGAFLVLQLRSDLRSAVNRELRTSSAAISHNFAHEGIDGFKGVSAATLRRSGAVAQLIDTRGTVLRSYGGDAAQDPILPTRQLGPALAGSPAVMSLALGDRSSSFLVETRPVDQGGQRRLLVVGEPLQGVDEAVRRILVLLLIAGPIVLLASGAAGWLLLRNALAPVDRMRRHAEEISIERLDQRLAAPYAADEVGQLATTLNAMLARLQAGVAARRQLVADASHELRTPLAAMRAELDVALREAGRTDRERAVMESLRDEVDRMSRTVDNLLTLARADSHQLELLRTDVDLRELADDVVTRLTTLAASAGVTLESDGPAVRVRGDGPRLTQALVNLVENAIKYTPGGGAVTVRTRAAPGEAAIVVRDDGIGIASADRERIFDRFYRADRSRSRESGGSGLGLAICWEIAVAHGGRIEVESEEGAGSTFILVLPAGAEAGRGPAEPAITA